MQLFRAMPVLYENNFVKISEQGDYSAVSPVAIMKKKTQIQFVRVTFIAITLVCFSASNLLACVCAAKKLKKSFISCHNECKKVSTKPCCVKVGVVKTVEKVCCKKICCSISRRQDTIIERNKNNMAFIANLELRSISLNLKIIPEKPFYRTAFVSPCAARLCVFLC